MVIQEVLSDGHVRLLLFISQRNHNSNVDHVAARNLVRAYTLLMYLPKLRPGNETVHITVLVYMEICSVDCAFQNHWIIPLTLSLGMFEFQTISGYATIVQGPSCFSVP